MVAQFVPVKIDVASPEFREWERDHPSEGRSIPIIYVVRADGEALYAKSGSLPGDALPELLIQALDSSGRVLGEAEVTNILEVTEEFKERQANNDTVGAIKSLNKLKRIGVPGEINSYADSATELNRLVNEMATTYRTQLTALGEKVQGDIEEEKLDSILQFLQLRRTLSGFKPLKDEIAAFQKQLSRGNEIRQLHRDVKIIDAATLAKSESSQQRTRIKLRELIDSTDSAAVKKYASDILQKLEADMP